MPRRFLTAVLTATTIVAVGCSGDDTDGPTADAGGSPDAGVSGDGGELPGAVTIGGDRPAQLQVPAGYDGSPTPLVLSLHGYISNGQAHDAYFGLSERVDARGFFLISPDGSREDSALQFRFWNATDACCNFTDRDVDDVTYLLELIDEAASRFAIDPARVYIVGHSNGGFMAYRMACDAADRVAAVASLAGATFADEARCGATTAVSVLQLHGTLDTVIQFGGGDISDDPYPSAEETVGRWAARAGCTGPLESLGTTDLVPNLAGEETERLGYSTGCAAGISVRLWRINGGSHTPAFATDYADRLLDFLYAHPKP